jgi:hypothetical protein
MPKHGHSNQASLPRSEIVGFAGDHPDLNEIAQYAR